MEWSSYGVTTAVTRRFGRVCVDAPTMFISDINMIIAALLMYIASVGSNEVEECIFCIKVNTTCYNVTYLFDLEASFRNRIVINKLGVLKSTNTLYFSFEPCIEDKQFYKIGFINLDNPVNVTEISGSQIMNFGTFDVDQKNELIYLGGSDGIYVLDTKLHELRWFSSRGDIIISLFYNINIYFVRYGEYKIVRKKGDNFDIVQERIPVKDFVINKYNVMVFLSSYGLFASKKDEFVCLSRNSYFRGLVIDSNDNIYSWWLDGIYKVVIEPKLAESRIERVAILPELGAMTFDKDNNFIFTVGKSVFRLDETNNSTVCD